MYFLLDKLRNSYEENQGKIKYTSMILEFFFNPKTHLYVKNKARNGKFRSKLTKAPDFWP